MYQYLILASFALFTQPLLAQEMLKVKHYGVDQGLPQSTVWDIHQDNYGFLWVSTADGLCRFDGYKFNTYRNNPDDSTSIGGNTTHLLIMDSQGDLWLTHDQGLDKYSSDKGDFYRLFRYKDLRSSVFNKTIGEDSAGFIWVWIGGEGLMKFDKRTNKQVEKFSAEGEQIWRNNQYSRDALLDSKGQIWITQRSTSLISFNIKKNKFKFIETGLELSTLCQASDSILLIGTPKGLLRYNTFTDAFEKIYFHQPQQQHSINYQTTKILRVDSDEFWVGTHKGIFVYHDRVRNFAQHYTSCSGGKDNFLFVQTMFMDKSHNIWIGTNGDGLKKYSPKAAPWKHYWSASDRGDIVKSIYADGEDRVLVGYFDNGLDVFSKSKGFVRKIRKAEAPLFLPNDMVYAMAGINKSKVLISFSGARSAFGIFDYDNRTFQDISSAILKQTNLEELHGNDFPAIIQVDKETLIFDCKDALIQGRFVNNKDPEFILLKQFENEVINSIYKDSDNNIWVGTLNGYYKRKSGSKEWLKGNQELAKQIKSICEDVEGKIWMGTTSGLYILNQEGIIEKILRTGNPLVNEFIYGILCDNNGDMWFSHNKGLTRYDHEKRTFRHFSVDDGLQSNEFNTGAYFKSSAGELFFGGLNGVNSFFPDQIKENPNVSTVQFTQIDVNDKPFKSSKVNWAQKELILDYTDNTLALEFAGLEFTEPIKNQYAWRMSGIDKDWVFSGNKRFTRYANIPPGKYQFEVKASNNDGIWNEIPATLHINIIPPFWQTWWFRILELLLGVAVVSLTAYLISRQRYKRKLMAMEIQQKIQRDRERISRELHDNIGAQLSLISSDLDWITGPDSTLTEHERKKRFGNITQLSKDVTRDLRETIWALNKEEISFSDLTDKLKLIAQKLMSVHPKVILNFNSKGIEPRILAPEEALNLLRICQEAIHNSIKHSGMNTLEISWQCYKEYFEIVVQDDGQGFIHKVNNQGHYGLENMRKRAEEIGASLKIISSKHTGTAVILSK